MMWETWQDAYQQVQENQKQNQSNSLPDIVNLQSIDRWNTGKQALKGVSVVQSKRDWEKQTINKCH